MPCGRHPLKMVRLPISPLPQTKHAVDNQLERTEGKAGIRKRTRRLCRNIGNRLELCKSDTGNPPKNAGRDRSSGRRMRRPDRDHLSTGEAGNTICGFLQIGSFFRRNRLKSRTSRVQSLVQDLCFTDGLHHGRKRTCGCRGLSSVVQGSWL